MTLHLLPRTSRHGGRRGSLNGSMSSGMSSTSSHGMLMSHHSTGSSTHMRTSSGKREHIQKYKRRLESITALPTNATCSDCPEPHPTWASLLVPLVGGAAPTNHKHKAINTDTRLGVLCCFKCYSYHFQMGQAVCHVKNMKMAEECKSFCREKERLLSRCLQCVCGVCLQRVLIKMADIFIVWFVCCVYNGLLG